MSNFEGVNRRPRRHLLVHRYIEAQHPEQCKGCEHLDQGNDRCVLFDCFVEQDPEAEPGHGWWRTTQCLEAEREAKLYLFKTNGIERAAARSGHLFKEMNLVTSDSCDRVTGTTHRCRLPKGHDGQCDLIRVRHG